MSTENDKAVAVVAHRTALGTTEETIFSFPNPTTVKGQVLADLLAGRRITHKHCWLEHGSSRLAHHIYILRGSGWPIHCDEIEVGTSDGRHVTIGEYYLESKAICEAGKHGHRFLLDARSAACK